MSVLTRSCLVTVFCAAAAAAQTLAISAQEPAQIYTVTSVSQTGAGHSVVHEVLSLQRAGSRFRLSVSSADGGMFSVPVALTAQGQIASGSQDASVTCYNMAIGVLAQQGAVSNSAGEPPSVFVQFFSSVVQVPLHVLATREQGKLRTIALRGTSAGVVRNAETATAAGIVIEATVGEENGTLRDATFDETHYLGAPAQIVGRSSCVLQRALPARSPATPT